MAFFAIALTTELWSLEPKVHRKDSYIAVNKEKRASTDQASGPLQSRVIKPCSISPGRKQVFLRFAPVLLLKSPRPSLKEFTASQAKNFPTCQAISQRAVKRRTPSTSHGLHGRPMTVSSRRVVKRREEGVWCLWCDGKIGHPVGHITMLT